MFTIFKKKFFYAIYGCAPPKFWVTDRLWATRVEQLERENAELCATMDANEVAMMRMFYARKRQWIAVCTVRRCWLAPEVLSVRSSVCASGTSTSSSCKYSILGTVRTLALNSTLLVSTQQGCRLFAEHLHCICLLLTSH